MYAFGTVCAWFGALLLAADPEPGDCTWNPRFELLMRSPERDVVYIEETVEVDVWLSGLCPKVAPELTGGSFGIVVEWLGGSAPKPCWCGIRFDPANWAMDRGRCAEVTSCCYGSSESARWVRGRVYVWAWEPPCLRLIPVPPDGRVLVGTAKMSWERKETIAVTVGRLPEGVTYDNPPRKCWAYEAYFVLYGKTLCCFQDSDPLEIRVVELPFVRGDAYQDGQIDISDAVHILEILFLGRYEGFRCAHAADVDDSNRHEITDAILLLMYLFQGGAPPPAPFPEPGYDPTPTTQDPELVGCYQGVFN